MTTISFGRPWYWQTLTGFFSWGARTADAQENEHNTNLRFLIYCTFFFCSGCVASIAEKIKVMCLLKSGSFVLTHFVDCIAPESHSKTKNSLQCTAMSSWGFYHLQMRPGPSWCHHRWGCCSLPSWLWKKSRETKEKFEWGGPGGSRLRRSWLELESVKNGQRHSRVTPGDTPQEEQETETCETEVRSDGMNMEGQEGEAGEAK